MVVLVCALVVVHALPPKALPPARRPFVTPDGAKDRPGRLPGRARLDEPFVLVARMRSERDRAGCGSRPSTRGCDQRIRSSIVPRSGWTPRKIRDVVAPVTVRRREGRVEPDAVDAEPLEVVQAPSNAYEVADTVAVRISERPRIRLVENAAVPPRLPGRSHAQRYPGQRGSRVAATAPERARRAAVPGRPGLGLGRPRRRGLRADDNLPDSLRGRLEREVPFSTLELVQEAKADDGTVKALFRTHDGHPVEAVLMRFRDGRRSVCLSSQSGCRSPARSARPARCVSAAI